MLFCVSIFLAATESTISLPQDRDFGGNIEINMLGSRAGRPNSSSASLPCSVEQHKTLFLYYSHPKDIRISVRPKAVIYITITNFCLSADEYRRPYMFLSTEESKMLPLMQTEMTSIVHKASWETQPFSRKPPGSVNKSACTSLRSPQV